MANPLLAIMLIPEFSGKMKRKKRGKGFRRKSSRKSSRWDIYGNAGKQVLRDIASLKRIVNVEHKYLDQKINAAVLGDSTALLQSFFGGCVLGTFQNTRNGISIKCLYITFRFSISVGTFTPANVRFMCVVDANANGALFAIGDLFEAAVNGTNYVQSQFSMDNVSRFIVLHDEQFYLNSVAKTTHEIVMTIPWEHHIEYNSANSGAIGGLNRWAPYIYALSDSVVTPANGPILTGYVRLVFVDN